MVEVLTIEGWNNEKKYVIGKITMVYGNEYSLLEIERESRLLSMFILKTNNDVKRGNIYSILLIGLIDEGGTWNTKKIQEVKKLGVYILRKRHIKNLLC